MVSSIFQKKGKNLINILPYNLKSASIRQLKALFHANYTAGINVWGGSFLAVHHHNHKNWVPAILTHNLWLIFMGKQKCNFCLFYTLCQTAWRPYRLSHINALCINLTTHSRTNPWNFCETILRIGGFKNLSFLSRPFLIFFKKMIG